MQANMMHNGRMIGGGPAHQGLFSPQNAILNQNDSLIDDAAAQRG
jgi:hypothetical protein